MSSFIPCHSSFLVPRDRTRLNVFYSLKMHLLRVSFFPGVLFEHETFEPGFSVTPIGDYIPGSAKAISLSQLIDGF